MKTTFSEGLCEGKFFRIFDTALEIPFLLIHSLTDRSTHKFDDDWMCILPPRMEEYDKYQCLPI